MPDYNHRKIELTPRRHSDENWSCQYVIIEFRQTSWGYRQGQPDGIFASRPDATAGALKEAKRISDSFEPTLVVGTYADRLRKMILSFLQGLCIGKFRSNPSRDPRQRERAPSRQEG